MANKSYVARETPVVWKDSGGDLVMTLNNLAAGAGRVGAQKDWGAGSTPKFYSWRFTCQFETAPVVGERVELYLSTSDGSEEDGQEGVADAALGSTNSLRNMRPIGGLTVSSTDAAHDMTTSGICMIETRYVCPVIHNNTADNLKATANVSEFTLTPIPDEIQT
jgi:hypothetical protein